MSYGVFVGFVEQHRISAALSFNIFYNSLGFVCSREFDVSNF